MQKQIEESGKTIGTESTSTVTKPLRFAQDCLVDMKYDVNIDDLNRINLLTLIDAFQRRRLLGCRIY